jgi:hypothetical protein
MSYPQIRAYLHKFSTKEYGSVACQGVSFGTHQHSYPRFDSLEYLLKSFLENRQPGDKVISGLSFDVTAFLRPSRPKLSTKEHILNIDIRHGPGDNVFVELRRVLAVGA